LPGETIGDRSDLAALTNGAAMQQGRCNWQCITGYLLQIQMSLELFLIRLHVPVRRYQATDTKAQATSGVNLKLFVGSIKVFATCFMASPVVS